MGKQIIDLIGELVSISGNSTVDSIIFAIIGVISFLIAFGIVGLIFDAIGIYDSDLMSDTHWLIRVLVFVGLTWVGVKIAQLMGKLGRDHVVLLADKGIEMPSDLSGVVYTETGKWEIDLLKELKEMGYTIDFNKLF